MQQRLMTSFFSASGVARWVRPTVVGLGVACVSILAQGCGQAPGGLESPQNADPSADDALHAIDSCQSQARECFVIDDAAVCEEQLRSCLMSFLPDAGSPPSHPSHPEAGVPPAHPEGGTPPPHPQPDGGSDDDPRSDGGKPIPPNDGSPPVPPSHDAGNRTLPDAARGALNDPVGTDGGPAVHECVNDLRSCLASGAKPSECAEESRACLSRLRDGG